MIQDSNKTQPTNDGKIPLDSPGKDPVSGKFQKGNKCSKGGNSFIGEVQKLRSFLFLQIKRGDWAAVKEALINKAKSGDVKALTLLLSYALGKPTQYIDVNMTQAQITPEEARQRLITFFGLAEGDNNAQAVRPDTNDQNPPTSAA